MDRRDLPATEDPALDVVILTWNDGALLDQAVRSVTASLGVRANLIVVDNGSTPPARVDVAGAVVLRNEENQGVASGRNQGVSAGGSEIVCFLDSDAELAPRSLECLVEALSSDPTIGLAAPVFEGQRPEHSGGRAPTLWRKVQRVVGATGSYATVGEARDGIWDVDFAIGACQVFRRSAFDTVGGLDEGYFYGPEDVDFCLRLRRAGWRVVQVADADVRHPPRRRHRRVISRGGARHAWAVLRHHWRHRDYRRAIR